METYNTMGKTDSQWEFAIWLRELKQGLCDNLEVGDAEGDGRKVWDRGDMGVPMADSCRGLTTQFCKAIILQLKKIQWQKNKVICNVPIFATLPMNFCLLVSVKFVGLS